MWSFGRVSLACSFGGAQVERFGWGDSRMCRVDEPTRHVICQAAKGR